MSTKQKYQTKAWKASNESNKNVKQILSTVQFKRYQSIKSIKSISRSIKITSTGNHHDLSSWDIRSDICWPNAISCFSILLLSKNRFPSTSNVWNENFFRVHFYSIKPLILLISIKYRINEWSYNMFRKKKSWFSIFWP